MGTHRNSEGGTTQHPGAPRWRRHPADRRQGFRFANNPGWRCQGRPRFSPGTDWPAVSTRPVVTGGGRRRDLNACRAMPIMTAARATTTPTALAAARNGVAARGTRAARPPATATAQGPPLLARHRQGRASARSDSGPRRGPPPRADPGAQARPTAAGQRGRDRSRRRAERSPARPELVRARAYASRGGAGGGGGEPRPERDDADAASVSPTSAVPATSPTGAMAIGARNSTAAGTAASRRIISRRHGRAAAARPARASSSGSAGFHSRTAEPCRRSSASGPGARAPRGGRRDRGPATAAARRG